MFSCYHSAAACSLVGTWCDKTTLTYHNQVLVRIKQDPEVGLIIFPVAPIPYLCSGAVKYDSSSSTVIISLDNGKILNGTVSGNCTVITTRGYLDPGVVWTKTAEAQNVHVVFMNHLDVGYAS